jgi:hypothetical protein
VIDLCERALRIDITLDEVERLWPDPPQDTELAAIREDLLFGLELCRARGGIRMAISSDGAKCQSTTTSNGTCDDCALDSHQHRRSCSLSVSAVAERAARSGVSRRFGHGAELHRV